MATADDWYDQWRTDWEIAASRLEHAREQRDEFGALPHSTIIEIGYVLSHLHNLQCTFISVLQAVIDYSLVNQHFGTLLYFLARFYDNPPGEAEPYELTAAKIMAAWVDASKDVRLMTVLTLDELRREAWNEQFVSYKIAPPGPG